MTTLQELTQHLCSAYRTGSNLALLFDYDGTLTPIVEHPDLACLSSATRGLLRRLAERPRVFLGMISGRGLDDLRYHAGLSGLAYAGSGGLELELNRQRFYPPHAQRGEAFLRSMADSLQRIADQFPGAWVELKPLSLTLHYRQVRPDRIAPLRHAAGLVLHHWRESHRCVNGPMAMEITPTLGWDKGTAVTAMLRHFGLPVLPLYFGDHDNDRPGMAAALEAGGFAVGVGAAAPDLCSYRLPEPNSVVAFLTGLDLWLGSVSDGHLVRQNPIASRPPKPDVVLS